MGSSAVLLETLGHLAQQFCYEFAAQELANTAREIGKLDTGSQLLMRCIAAQVASFANRRHLDSQCLANAA